MYAPQWMELVAKHLGWKGLRSAAWYFHAHINEQFSAEKETIVAHYSQLRRRTLMTGPLISLGLKKLMLRSEKNDSICYTIVPNISLAEPTIADHNCSQMLRLANSV